MTPRNRWNRPGSEPVFVQVGINALELSAELAKARSIFSPQPMVKASREEHAFAREIC